MVDTPEQIIATLKGFSERSKKRAAKIRESTKRLREIYNEEKKLIFEKKNTKK